MPSIRTSAPFVRLGGLCLFATLAVSACHDAGTDPMAVILTEETRSTLHIRSDVPSLADLVERAELESDLLGAMDLWLGSWELEGAEAIALRDRAYAGASALLAEALGRAAVEDVHARLGVALDAVSAVPSEELGDVMRERIAVASRLHDEAVPLLAGGDEAEALALTLRASDALRAVGPEGVARMLTSRAQRAFEERRAEGDRDPALDRGERLLLGARLAMEEGNWSRATRRAFYACQVLGVSPR